MGVCVEGGNYVGGGVTAGYAVPVADYIHCAIGRPGPVKGGNFFPQINITIGQHNWYLQI
jgi:hypothetical protein